MEVLRSDGLRLIPRDRCDLSFAFLAMRTPASEDNTEGQTRARDPDRDSS